MPPPWVKKVTIKEEQIVLTVQADDFRTGENLEISGYATQTSGAFAVFDIIKTVPDPNPDDTVNMYVTATPSRPFTKGEAVTVTLRAGPVWVSVLEEPPTGQSRHHRLSRLTRPKRARPGVSLDQRHMPSPRPGRTTIRHPQEVKTAFRPAERSGRPGTRSAGTGLYHGTWWDLHQDDELEQVIARPLYPGCCRKTAIRSTGMTCESWPRR